MPVHVDAQLFHGLAREIRIFLLSGIIPHIIVCSFVVVAVDQINIDPIMLQLRKYHILGLRHKQI